VTTCEASPIEPGERAEFKFDRDAQSAEIEAAWCETVANAAEDGENDSAAEGVLSEIRVTAGSLGDPRDDHRCVVQKDNSTTPMHLLRLRCGFSKSAYKAIRKKPLLHAPES
jgi:hypothetical protein